MRVHRCLPVEPWARGRTRADRLVILVAFIAESEIVLLTRKREMRRQEERERERAACENELDAYAYRPSPLPTLHSTDATVSLSLTGAHHRSLARREPTEGSVKRIRDVLRGFDVPSHDRSRILRPQHAPFRDHQLDRLEAACVECTDNHVVQFSEPARVPVRVSLRVLAAYLS